MNVACMMSGGEYDATREEVTMNFRRSDFSDPAAIHFLIQACLGNRFCGSEPRLSSTRLSGSRRA